MVELKKKYCQRILRRQVLQQKDPPGPEVLQHLLCQDLAGEKPGEGRIPEPGTQREAPQHPCTITFEQFKDWCSRVVYIGHAGRTPESFTIDRRHNDIGYHIDNICVLKNSDNVHKYFYYDFRTKRAVYEVATEEKSTETSPF